MDISPPDLPKEFPQDDVADHEVFMSFAGDSDALAFREWWAEEGLKLFKKWAKNKNGE